MGILSKEEQRLLFVPLAGALAVAVVVTLFLLQLASVRTEQRVSQARSEGQERIVQLREQLEDALFDSYHVMHATAREVAELSPWSEERFAATGSRVLQAQDAISAIALVSRQELAAVYPPSLAQNVPCFTSKSIHRLSQNSSTSATLRGPLFPSPDEAQVCMAIPLSATADADAGILLAAINLASMLEKAGSVDFRLDGMFLGLSKALSPVAEGEFAGHERAFRDDAVTTRLRFHDAEWYFSMAPQGQWGPQVYSWVWVIALFSVAAGSLSWYLFHQLMRMHRSSQRLVPEMRSRRQAQQEVRRMSRALENSACSVLITDIDGLIEYANPKTCRVTGYSQAELLGNNPRLFSAGETPAEVYDAMWSDLLSGREWVGELLNRRKDGSLYWEHVAISPILNQSGRIMSYIAVKEDITRRRQVEITLERERGVLEAIAQARPSSEILRTICAIIQEQIPHSRCSFMLLDASGKVLQGCIHTDLPTEYVDLIVSVPVREASGSCGTAAYRRQPVIVSDIATDPFWSGPFRVMALKHGLNACWSWPVLSSTEEVLGTFAIYCRDQRRPEPHEELMVMRFASIAAIAVEKEEWREKLLLSEQRYRSFMESLNDGVIITQDGLLRYLNQSMAQMVGYGRESLTETPFMTYIHPDDQALAMDYHRRRMMGQQAPSEYDVRLLCHDGRVITVRVNSSLITWNNRPAALATVTDMTRRHEAQEQIRQLNENLERRVTEELKRRMETETLLEGVFENSSVGIVAIDGRGQVLRANATYCQMLGYCPEELREVGLDSLHPDDRLTVVEHFESLMDGSAAMCQIEIRYLTRDGGLLDVQIVASALNDENGDPRAILAMVKDISDLKVAIRRQRIQEQLLIQQSKMAVMGEMIGAITHQWKQPLNALSIILQEAREDYQLGILPPPVFSEAVERSLNHIDFMSRTIDDFRDFFRPDKSRVLFDIIEAVEEVEKLLQKQLHLHSVSVLYEISSENQAHRAIYTVANEVKQIVLNILNNAIDAIAAARVQGLLHRNDNGIIRVRLETTPMERILLIEDNGGGIPDEILPRIFKPYFTTKADKGTGIGLYLSRMIMENSLGGSISVTNTPSGACFRLAFPTLQKE